MNLNFKTICSVAVLMCLVPAVFGMQDGKRSCPDESAEPHSKERMITVSEREDFLKLLNREQSELTREQSELTRQWLEENLKSILQKPESARQNEGSATDQRRRESELNEFMQNVPWCLAFMPDTNDDGSFNIKVVMGFCVVDLGLHCKNIKEARNIAVKCVYDFLISKKTKTENVGSNS